MSSGATPRLQSPALYSSPSLSSAGPSRRGTPHQSRFPRRPSALSAVVGSDDGMHPGRPSKAALPNDEQDWSLLEPDEVFRRLPVLEVKRVEFKMRADALNKQTELRSMVGTRYRDLLTSASQITSLHSSSLRLSQSLKSVAATCANPTLESGAADGGPDDTDDDVTTMLPVAAHMKLLLDAPEALYSYLAHHQYLQAAYLWILARVVREGLNSMPENIKAVGTEVLGRAHTQPYLPILQKQWETLLPFRLQIVQRATTALRGREPMDAPRLRDKLLAVILLDSLPLSDALDLFLSQKLKTLRDILAHTSHGAKTSNAKSVSKVLAEAVKCLLSSADLVSAVFERKRRITGPESAIEEGIRLVQAGETMPAVPPQKPVQMRRYGHQRRASRLASISLPLPPRLGSAAGDGPVVSTPRVLQTLPSSQILLRYLPETITGFTPFIAPSPTPVLGDKLGPWQVAAVDILREALPGWLEGLNSVADVWAVRGAMRQMLRDTPPFEAQIWETFEAELSARVQAIWTAKLDKLVTTSEAALNSASDRVRAGEEVQDNDPETFMFSDAAMPAMPSAAFGASSLGFANLLGTLKSRSQFRTPLLDSVLGVLESAAVDLKADLGGLPSHLHDDYRDKVTHALDALVNVLGDVLAAAGGHRDATGSIEAELFVGRVALYLVHTSPFLTDIVGETGVDLTSTKNELMEIHESSTSQWQGRTVVVAMSKLHHLFDRPEKSPRAWQGTHPTQPSVPMTAALMQLVLAVRQLGIPARVSPPLGVVPNLVAAFTRAVDELEGWKEQTGDAAAQSALDLTFLYLLNGDDAATDANVKRVLFEVPEAFADYKAELPAIALEALRRTQLVLHPITAHLPPADKPARAASDTRSAALLRLGAPALRSGIGADFKSPIAVAKPGKRFGLLSIVV